MNISSTEKERYEELKGKELMIIPWKKEREIVLTDPDKSLSRCISDYAKQLGLYEKELFINGLSYPVKFNKKSVNESIASMCRHKSSLIDLAKLFTVLTDVVQNAVEIHDEEYRHKARRIAEDVLCVRHYMGGFCDETEVYPVKLTVEERRKNENTSVYVIITVGKIKKEALPIVRVHPSKNDGESLSGGVSSFAISIVDFVKFFNPQQGVLIKDLPDGLLSEAQIRIKNKVMQKDRERAEKMELLQRQLQEIQVQQRYLEVEPIDYDLEEEIEL